MKIKIIFDIDGTLSLNEHRVHCIDKEIFFAKYYPEYMKTRGSQLSNVFEIEQSLWNDWKPDWDMFYEMCDRDDLNNAVVQIYNTLFLHNGFGSNVYLFTGRRESVRSKTIQWFEKHQLPYDSNKLFMREDGDHREDHVLKLEWLNQIGGSNEVLCAFEDRQSVVNMWRAQGITCFQVAPGKF